MSVETLNTFITEGRLIRSAWVGTDTKGRETACLLAAISPEVQKSQSASSCPASLMPSWMAHLTPWIDDSGTLEHWPSVVRKYADLASRWSVLTPKAWDRCFYRVNLASVMEAMKHTENVEVLKACENVAVLLRRAISGDAVTNSEWAKVREAARAARVAAWVAAAAVGAAAWAVSCAAGWEVAVAARAARVAEVAEAAVAARAARVAEAAGWEAAAGAAKAAGWEAAAGAAAVAAAVAAAAEAAAEGAAVGAASDNIIDAILNILEDEISKGELSK